MRMLTGTLLLAFLIAPPTSAEAQQLPPALQGADAILGRWNLRLLNPRDVFSSWLEVERSGSTALVGRFVGLIGKSRPIGRIEWNQGVARFTIPVQWDLSPRPLLGVPRRSHGFHPLPRHHRRRE